MNEQKEFFTRLGEVLDQYRAGRRAAAQESAPARRQGWLHWLGRQMVPNVGTLLMVVVLLLTVPSLAAPLRAPAATSTSTISYQGRLADSSGNPLTDKVSVEFRIYDVPTGGVPLWTEMWTGGNAVDVSDGLFNVMLGSIDNTLASAIEGYDELYLGITVGTDSEMVPRVQLGSVPFSMQAMTVADNSITSEKIAGDAVGSNEIVADAVGSEEIADGSITTEKIAASTITTTHLLDGAVTSAKLNVDNGLGMNGNLSVVGHVTLGEGHRQILFSDPGNYDFSIVHNGG